MTPAATSQCLPCSSPAAAGCHTTLGSPLLHASSVNSSPTMLITATRVILDGHHGCWGGGRGDARAVLDRVHRGRKSLNLDT